MRSIDLIVIHCSATPNGDGLFRSHPGLPLKTPVDVIDGWHRERGFLREAPEAKTFNPQLRCIGYHFVIACNGAVFTGRSLQEVGAHAQGFNASSIGICLTGTDQYTTPQWVALAALLNSPQIKGLGVPLQAAQRRPHPRLPMGRPVVANGVCGHRDLSPDKDGDGLVEPFEYLKTCPGFDVTVWLERGMQALPGHVIPEV